MSPAHWSIGLETWIVQDGNYRDFAVGDRAEFALAFEPVGELAPAAEGPARAGHVEGNVYDVVGLVVLAEDGVVVLDFGLLAYREEGTRFEVTAGHWLQGRIALGIDPFAYFERLSRDPRYPDLVYTWDVTAIWQESAPFVDRAGMYRRDRTRRGRVSRARTDAWAEQGWSGSRSIEADVPDYVLDCALVDVPPKRTSTTAVA